MMIRSGLYVHDMVNAPNIPLRSGPFQAHGSNFMRCGVNGDGGGGGGGCGGRGSGVSEEEGPQQH